MKNAPLCSFCNKEETALDIFSALLIPDSRYEKKNTQNEHIIAHFEYFFTCH